MGHMIHSSADTRPLLRSETRPRMAKADLRKAETQGGRAEIGLAIQRAISLRGWSLKEFAAAVERDERQCSRWISGDERAQLDTLFAVETLRSPLIQALAELAGAAVEVTTEIRLKRTA